MPAVVRGRLGPFFGGGLALSVAWDAGRMRDLAFGDFFSVGEDAENDGEEDD